MGVLHPMKLVIENYPEGKSERFEIENNPNAPQDGTHTITFSRELWIERDDFMEEPIKGYFRLFPGNEVRLKTAYIVKCTGCNRCLRSGNTGRKHARWEKNQRNDPLGRREQLF